MAYFWRWRDALRRVRRTFAINSVRKRVDQGLFVARVYWKNSFLKQYHKLSGFLRQSHGQPAWNTRQLHEIICATFGLDPKTYRLSPLRYDLRKLRAHGLIERDGTRYAYRFTSAGKKAALLMTLFRKRIYGPIAAGMLLQRPNSEYMPNSKFERLYHKIDRDIDKLLDLLAA
jgi:hypothetical protein